jgi:hypothetical protein
LDNRLLKVAFWIAFAAFLSASVPHVAYFFRAFEPQDSSLFWWIVAYALAVSIDVMVLLLTRTVVSLHLCGAQRRLVASVWVFIILLALLSWGINWEYAVQFESGMLSRPENMWLVGMINPIIASMFQALIIAYTWISDKITQEYESQSVTVVGSQSVVQVSSADVQPVQSSVHSEQLGVQVDSESGQVDRVIDQTIERLDRAVDSVASTLDRVREYLDTYPGQSAREVARVLNIYPTTAAKHIKALQTA